MPQRIKGDNQVVTPQQQKFIKGRNSLKLIQLPVCNCETSGSPAHVFGVLFQI